MEVLDYLKKIESYGYEAYIVGGYVRDFLLGKKSIDIDISTSAPPKEIRKIFKLSNDGNMGSINIKTNLNIDITTFRQEDEYLNHKPKKVQFITDLKTDLERRDFTINTICMNKDGEIIDLLNGRKDLENRQLKVVGDVSKKLSEDPLRIMRALRFAITYDLNLGKEELIFILNNKNLLDEISWKRKKEEIDKILVSKYCIKGLEFLSTLNLQEKLGIRYDKNVVFVQDYIGVWAQIDYDNNYPFTRIEQHRIDNIRNIIKCQIVTKQTIFNYGLYDSLIAGQILGIPKSTINKMYNEMNIHAISELKIDGNKIKKILNISESPKIKEIKNDLIYNLVSGNLTNEENCLIEYIIEKWK